MRPLVLSVLISLLVLAAGFGLDVAVKAARPSDNISIPELSATTGVQFPESTIVVRHAVDDKSKGDGRTLIFSNEAIVWPSSAEAVDASENRTVIKYVESMGGDVDVSKVRRCAHAVWDVSGKQVSTSSVYFLDGSHLAVVQVLSWPPGYSP